MGWDEVESVSENSFLGWEALPDRQLANSQWYLFVCCLIVLGIAYIWGVSGAVMLPYTQLCFDKKPRNSLCSIGLVYEFLDGRLGSNFFDRLLWISLRGRLRLN